MTATKQIRTQRAQLVLDSFAGHNPYPAMQIELGLRQLHDIQRGVGGMVDDCIPEDDEPLTPEQILLYGYALTDEVHEFLKEMQWKTWKDRKPLQDDRVLDEFADVLAFLGIMLVYLDHEGFTMQDIAQAYIAKVKRNAARFQGQETGYKEQSLGQLNG